MDFCSRRTELDVPPITCKGREGVALLASTKNCLSTFGSQNYIQSFAPESPPAEYRPGKKQCGSLFPFSYILSIMDVIVYLYSHLCGTRSSPIHLFRISEQTNEPLWARKRLHNSDHERK